MTKKNRYFDLKNQQFILHSQGTNKMSCSDHHSQA